MGRSLIRALVVVLLGAGLAEAQYVGYWPPAAADPVACTVAEIRAYYYNTTSNRFRICDGTAWANIPTSGAESDTVVEKSVDLGTTGGLVFTATVTAGAVGATSKIVCQPFATSADGQTVETYYAAGLSVAAGTIVAGVSFDIGIYSPHGATGTYRFHCFYR